MKILPTLIVDLDGTLISTDSLLESAILLIKRNPLYLSLIIFWVIKGRARLKAEIASRVELDIDSLPYNLPFLEWLNIEKDKGRQIYLATAAHNMIAVEVSKKLQIFAGVLASDESHNLKGETKLEAIKDTFGEDFVYAGNSRADLPIWLAATSAVMVSVPQRLAAEVRKNVGIEKEFPPAKIGLRTWLRALRIHQWVKNTLLFVPLLTAFEFMDLYKVGYMILAFFAYSMVASATYILNDIWDLKSDRRHSRKCLRPFASGKIHILNGLGMAGLLLILAFVVAQFVSISFVYILITYLILTSVYSLFFKEYVVIDILMLSCLYTLRIIAGAIVISVAMSPWLLEFSMFLFLSLALIKRCAELVSIEKLVESSVISGRDYNVADLVVLWPLGVGASISAIVVFGLFISAPQTQMRYATPELLWAVAIGIIYWLGRMWIKTSRGEMHDDPIVYVIKDRISYLVLCSLIVLTLVAYFYTI
jgi:4-hydroxybenzoate polyprenyltransferase